ncbi:MAG: ATP-binding protein [Bryobacterales bacterium]|nr:ATP-binding protein [Bryobacterales bacterium]
MIARRAKAAILDSLGFQAAVAIVGPRQVGKTTLALEIAAETSALYLDLEDRADRQKLEEPRLFLEQYQDRLVILDEIHRVPDLFGDLRGIIDRGRRRGLGTGRFLILGSASVDLLLQSGESLAGRIAYVNLCPFDTLEVGHEPDDLMRLWIRGGYPDSFLAPSRQISLKVREHFIRTYLERDVAEFGPRLPSTVLERLWTMLAYSQGELLNASKLANSLGTSYQTVTRYIDVLAGLLLVRRLPPLRTNLKKRLVKSPRVYVRDSGLVHALLSIGSFNTLSGHPVVGKSWEGFVIENLISAAPDGTLASFYRTAAGAEADLVLDFPGGQRWSVEIKRSLAPSLTKGSHNARRDISPDRSFIAYPGQERFTKGSDVEVIGLQDLVRDVAGMSRGSA